MALPIEPTKTVTGKQAEKHLAMLDNDEVKQQYTVSLKTPKKTLDAVKKYLSNSKVKKK